MHPPKILVVDDDPLLLAAESDLLRGEGFEVTAVEGGSDALAALSTRDFDLVVTDLSMPVVDGFDVIAAARARRDDLRVVVVTARADLDAAVRALRGGAYDFVQKGAAPDALLAAIRRATAPAGPIAVGDRLDEWVIDAHLGRGGDGAVYRAHHAHDPRAIVAIKVYHRAEPRLAREAEVLRSIVHPNIVHLHHVRADGPSPYLVLDYVDGPTLGSWMRAGPMDPEHAVGLFRQAVDAVAYLHRRGLQHRDLKPSNFLFDRVAGRLKLVDFGHVHGRRVAEITDEAIVFGTVSYSPPEHASSGTDPARGDVYALGVILHELLVGEPAFRVPDGLAPFDRMRAVFAMKQAGPLDPGPGVPERLRRIVRRATSVDPTRRHASAAELDVALSLDG